MVLSLTDHDLGCFLEKHMAQHTFAYRVPQRSQGDAGNVSHSLKFNLQASPQEVILFSRVAPHASLSSNFTWKYRTIHDGFTPCLWSKNKGQASNTRLLQ